MKYLGTVKYILHATILADIDLIQPNGISCQTNYKDINKETLAIHQKLKDIYIFKNEGILKSTCF